MLRNVSCEDLVGTCSLTCNATIPLLYRYEIWYGDTQYIQSDIFVYNIMQDKYDNILYGNPITVHHLI